MDTAIPSTRPRAHVHLMEGNRCGHVRQIVQDRGPQDPGAISRRDRQRPLVQGHRLRGAAASQQDEPEAAERFGLLRSERYAVPRDVQNPVKERLRLVEPTAAGMNDTESQQGSHLALAIAYLPGEAQSVVETLAGLAGPPEPPVQPGQAVVNPPRVHQRTKPIHDRQ